MYRFTFACGAIFLYWWVIFDAINKRLTGEDEWIYISTILSVASELMYYLAQYGKGIVGNMHTEKLIRETLKGLLATAIKKVCLLDEEYA